MRARGPVRASLAVTLVLLTVAVGSCGGDDDGSDATSASLVEGVEVGVSAIDNTFRPGKVEVAAGTEVVWTNDGRNDHNVVPVDDADWGVAVESFVPDAEHRHRFTEPGTYDYYCSLHGTPTKGMVGTITVTG